ncbi:MAG: copper homeostasis protein CutC [bacterium]
MIDVEICCNSIASAVAAKDGCATRIELCRDLECGGLTPSDEEIAYCVRKLGLRTHVLIRPRAGNFCYTEAEQMGIIASVKRCKELGAAAVVLGFLTEEGKVDVEITRRMVQLASPMEVTFHRAFDEALQDPIEALWDVAAARCHRMLTSGQRYSALEGAEVIKSLIGVTGVEILAGGGVTPMNVRRLVKESGVHEVHGSCKKTLDDGSIVTDAATVRQLIDQTLTL